MTRTFRSLFLALPVVGAWLLAASGLGAAESPPTPEQAAFFEKNIRPVLVRECFSCHSAAADKLKGGLALDTRDGLRKGGDRGPALVPGKPGDSLLLQALRHAETADGDTLKMPPKKKLDDRVAADFEKWIAMGAPDPRGGAPRASRSGIDIEEGRKFWAFQPPRKTDPPAVRDAAWPRGDIDRYLLAALEAKGLHPVPDADPRTLLRRLTFDLTGLPPTPEDIERFARDHAADPAGAVAAAADRLLASPAFGQRWGRHWLDVARYAESSGRSANFAYPQAWRYRDYVIAAFNADKPYDQFIREQLAGDLLSAGGDDARRAELTVATGFLAIGPKSHNERNPRQFQADLIDEQIDATFQAFQALTVACARCHDHKFDPISQKDYTALAGIFRSTETCYGTIRVLQSNFPSALIPLPKGSPVALEPLTAQRRAAIEKQIEDTREQMNRTTTGQDAFIRRVFTQGRITQLRSQLAQYDAEGTPIPQAMGVREAPFPGDSRVNERGDVSQPGEMVPRGFPRVLTPPPPSRPKAIWRGSGRRELADLLASKDNPLTARVMANRAWLHLIGRGLVATPDNFGASGQSPSHPELLDHLALSFTGHGWSVKKLVRSIVTSRAYQLSSQFDDRNFEADPDNVFVWRMPRRRLEAEALRDTMLALADHLDPGPARGSAVALGGEGNVTQRFRLLGAPGMGPAMMPGRGGPGMGPGMLRRPGLGLFGGPGPALPTTEPRTVFQAVVRDDLPEVLTLFDFPDPSLIAGERATTTVPAQALFLMNNPFVINQADGLALRLRTTGEDDDARLTRAYLLCYSRPPSSTELERARDFLETYGKDHSSRAAWAALCQALFASAEFSQR